MRKVIITVAPTGGFATKQTNPCVPTQPDEIVADAVACAAAGASVVALHARRPDDLATCDPKIYTEINEAIRSRSDIVLNNSTGGGINGDLVASSGPLRDETLAERRELAILAGAELCSLNAMTVLAYANPRPVLMSTPWPDALSLATRMRQLGIKPEWEVFSPTHLAQDVIEAHRSDEVTKPLVVNLCMGLDQVFQGAMPYSPRTLQYLADLLPPDAVFTVSCHGPDQIRALAHSILLGGHIRVGIEDYGRDSLGRPRTNVELVGAAVGLVRALGCEPATPDEARVILGLERKHV